MYLIYITLLIPPQYIRLIPININIISCFYSKFETRRLTISDFCAISGNNERLDRKRIANIHLYYPLE